MEMIIGLFLAFWIYTIVMNPQLWQLIFTVMVAKRISGNGRNN